MAVIPSEVTAAIIAVTDILVTTVATIMGIITPVADTMAMAITETTVITAAKSITIGMARRRRPMAVVTEASILTAEPDGQPCTEGAQAATGWPGVSAAVMQPHSLVTVAALAGTAAALEVTGAAADEGAEGRRGVGSRH